MTLAACRAAVSTRLLLATSPRSVQVGAVGDGKQQS
jgi:hypothetical protein